MMRRSAVALACLLLAACATPRSGAPVTVGILAINDFHGNLEPPGTSVAAPDGKGGTKQEPAGGAAHLASAIRQLRGKYAHSVTVSAGDLIGASPFVSALFLDEPAIAAMNRIGLDFNAVGNHEFDRGSAELLRMQHGGCAKHTARAPCRLERFAGARFAFLAASTFDARGRTLFPASAIRRFGKGRGRVSLGVIGLTLRATPTLVSPGGVAGLSFGDEAEAINREVARLKARGADAIAVLIHQGGRTADPLDPDGCNALSGDIVPILARLDPRVDLVVSGHTHWAYVCDFGRFDPSRPLLLTSAGLHGKLVTDIALTIDPAAGRVVGRRADNVIVEPGRFAADAAIAALVRRYADAAAAEAQRPAGRLAAPAAGHALANLIADAQLAATRGAGARIALTNPFGIRAALTPASDGALTYGDLFRVQPFDNALLTQTMTGAELKAALEQGLDEVGPMQALAPSAGFAYRHDRSRPAGNRIVAMALDGQPLDPAASYRVTTNLFLAMGGDTFLGFSRQRAAAVGMSDIAALEAWLKAEPARGVPADVRVEAVVR